MNGTISAWPPVEPGPDRPHRNERRRWVPMAIGATVVVLAALWLITRPTQTDRMREMPELYLTYPGAVVLRDAGDAVSLGDTPTVRRLYGAGASISEVEDWYREQLTTRGWQPGAGASVGVSNIELAVCAWHTDPFRLRLGFWRSDTWHALEPDGPDYASVYEVAIIAAETRVEKLECVTSPLE